ncbi:unnamed protein product [Effrenium voratum]|nr:unnamed protein product [Effrenium voratum]
MNEGNGEWAKPNKMQEVEMMVSEMMVNEGKPNMVTEGMPNNMQKDEMMVNEGKPNKMQEDKDKVMLKGKPNNMQVEEMMVKEGKPNKMQEDEVILVKEGVPEDKKRRVEDLEVDNMPPPSLPPAKKKREVLVPVASPDEMETQPIDLEAVLGRVEVPAVLSLSMIRLI